MEKKDQPRTKRDVMRERRKQRERQKRLFLIGGVLVLVLIIVGLFIIPSLLINQNVDVVTREDRPAGEGTALGSPDAPVTVEVFEDFLCSACKTFTEGIEQQIVENYVTTGQVQYIYRLYPFLDDQAATKPGDLAANAAMCAAEQDRFWDYHDSLFANFGVPYSDSLLIAIADKLGLNMGDFRSCLNDREYQDSIDQDIQRGIDLGVSGTPTVFVNGQRVGEAGYVPSYEQISAVIDSALTP